MKGAVISNSFAGLAWKNTFLSMVSIVSALLLVLSCSDDPEDIEYAAGYPSKLAGNWVVFQFHGGDLEGSFSGPYDLVSALDPSQSNSLILDNIYNTGNRARVEVRGDTGLYAHKTDQLEVINKGGYGIETISIDGYIDTEPYAFMVNFIYSMAASSFENIAFSADAIDDIIFFRAGLYDEIESPVDSVLILGYRKTGFENVDYND